MIIYYLYAERHPIYGRNDYGYFTKYKTAEKLKDKEYKRIKKDKSNTITYKLDGYYNEDWHIEEIEVNEE